MPSSSTPSDKPSDKPRAVLWDADGVLQDHPMGEQELAAAAGAILGTTDPDQLRRFHAEATAAEAPCLSGRGRWREVLPGVLEQWGVADRAAEMLDLWCTTQARPDSIGLVHRVHSFGTPCFLASNQDEHRAAVMDQQLGYADWLDGTLYSCDLGAAKPEPAYFTAALERIGPLGEDPSRVVFVDDRADNVATARSLGIHGICWTWRDGLDVLQDALTAAGVPH